MALTPAEAIQWFKKRGGVKVSQDLTSQVWSINDRRYTINTMADDISEDLKKQMKDMQEVKAAAQAAAPELFQQSRRHEAQRRLLGSAPTIVTPVRPLTVSPSTHEGLSEPTPVSVVNPTPEVPLVKAKKAKKKHPKVWGSTRTVTTQVKTKPTTTDGRGYPRAKGTSTSKWDKGMLALIAEAKDRTRVSNSYRLPFVKAILKREPSRVWRADKLVDQLPPEVVKGKSMYSLVTQLKIMSKRSPELDFFRSGLHSYIRLNRGQRGPKALMVAKHKGKAVERPAHTPYGRMRVAAEQGFKLPKVVLAQVQRVEQNIGTTHFDIEVGRLLGMLNSLA